MARPRNGKQKAASTTPPETARAPPENLTSAILSADYDQESAGWSGDKALRAVSGWDGIEVLSPRVFADRYLR